MNATYYLLKVVLCSGVLFGYYHLALRNRLFHQWNRFYLLLAVVVSLVLPLLRFEVWADDADLQQPVMYSLHQADNYFIGALPKPDKFSVEDWLSVGYATVSCILLAAIVFSLLRIRRLLKSHQVELIDDIRFVNTNEPGTPFSFFRFVFWNKAISLSSEAGQKILRHEVVHVVERHTYDKLFVRLVSSLFWYNPFFWLIGRELGSIHEFIADKKSAGDSDIPAFARMLLQTAFPTHHQTLFNPFFQTSIKRRIAMLFKIQNPKRAYLGRVLALPLLAIIVVLFSFRNRPASENNSIEIIAERITNTASSSDTIPTKPKKTISSVDVKTKKELTITYTDGSSETMSENEANARGLINDGVYGNQQTAPSLQSVIIRGKDTAKNPPLIIVEGKEMRQEEMNKIDPNRIQSVDVLKDKSAIEKYGDKGANGVIIIKLKDGMLTQNANDRDSTLKEQIVIGHRTPPSTDQNKEIAVIGKPAPVDPNKEVVVVGYAKQRNSRGGRNSINRSASSDLGEVFVIGKPANKRTNETITVVGYGKPQKNDNNDQRGNETDASVDPNEWRLWSNKYTTPIFLKLNKSAVPGTYKIQMRFTVDAEGKVSNISALNNPWQDLDKQMIKALQSSPKWKPATKDGKVISSKVVYPFTYTVDDK